MRTKNMIWAQVCKLIKRVTALEASVTPTLNVTDAPYYEYRDVWAEESSALNANSAEWSFGNGATGYMGLPVDAGWEITDVYFHADTYASTAQIQVDVMNYGNVPSNAAANTLTSISLGNATDGGGATNNAYKYVTLASPVPVPVGVLGFITRTLTGSVSDARVGVRLRRQIGNVVTNVTLT